MAALGTPSYAPIVCAPVMDSACLPKPHGLPGTWQEFVSSLPGGGMNLLATDGQHLYLGHSRESVAVYAISRSRGTQLIPVFSTPIQPPVTINNLRVANFPDEQGGSLLLMTGGNANGQEHASITALRIPRAIPDSLIDEGALLKSWTWKTSRACTITIPLCSAWGLDVHNPTGRFVLSTNSREILVLSFRTDRLEAMLRGEAPNESNGERFPEEVLLFKGERINRTYQNNIPTVKFSPCGNLLASGSIDCSFALHDVRSGSHASGAILYQKHIDDSEPFFSNEFVWCVQWLEERAICDVPSADTVWLESDMQTVRIPNEVKTGLSFQPAPIESIFRKEKGDIVDVDQWKNHVARYDDCIEPDPGVGTDVAQQWRADQFREHHFCENYYAKSGSSGLREEDYRGVDHRCEMGQPFWRKEEPILQDHTWSGSIESPPNDDYEEIGGKQRRLLLVGRELNLHLYRVIGDSPGKNSTPFVEEVHRLQMFSRQPGYHNSAFLDCLELPQLSAFILIARGHGVFLMRVLRATGASGRETLRLYSERTFPQPTGLNEPWRRDQTSVIGACVVPRGEERSGTVCYELWILWKHGMVEAWELKEEIVADPSVIV